MKITCTILSTAYQGRESCSTWGNYHFKTFDGSIFHLPNTCNYVFVSQCKKTFEEFTIQLQRQAIDGVTTINKVTLVLWGARVELTNTSVRVNDKLWVCLDNVTSNCAVIYWLQGWRKSYYLTGIFFFFLSPAAFLYRSARAQFQLKELTPLSTSRQSWVWLPCGTKKTPSRYVYSLCHHTWFTYTESLM